MAPTPQELILKRNEIAAEVAKRLTSTSSTTRAAASPASRRRAASGSKVTSEAMTATPTTDAPNTQIRFTPGDELNNMFMPVARVDLGDGFYVNVLVQPDMDGDPTTFG